MKRVWKYGWAQLALVSLWPILVCAQSSDLAHFGDCKNGLETCDRSNLTQSELPDVAFAAHQRNVSDCRNGYATCDRSKLTGREAVALAVADHQKNVSNCTMGLGVCDPSHLTPSESREWNVVAHRRNLFDCQEATLPATVLN